MNPNAELCVPQTIDAGAAGRAVVNLNRFDLAMLKPFMIREDFWFPPGDIKGREHHLHIILTFRETQPGRHRVRRYRALEA
ncbi:DUF2813 domain-containing protein, partial [Salmonella enterica subsp. enterica serovar Kentucky]|nr:DUF2813 domain-containing protein [Salmonella enterica subsp. enterica serovar Kentucky]